jgi:hypothetical protein
LKNNRLFSDRLGLQAALGEKCIDRENLAASGRVKAERTSTCSPQTGHPAKFKDRNFDGIPNGRSWPTTAGHPFL